MATATLRPDGAGNYSEWGVYPFLSTNWQNVDEASSDGDTTYNKLSAGADDKRDSYTLETWSPGAATISSVTVHIMAKRAGTIYTVKPFLRLNSTNSDGSAETPAASYTEYSQQISRPGGGSWSVSDINSLEAGIYSPDDGTPGKSDYVRVTQVWIVVSYTVAGDFPAPTSLLCERETSPTDASEDPIFSAIFNGDDSGDTATHAQIQVSEVSDFATTVWSSGWIDITDVDDGDRCVDISYNGSTLSSDPPGGQYYWKIMFKDAVQESVWSTYATLQGINRAWADNAFASRFKLLLDVDHPQIDSGYDFKVDFQTGLRKAVANNGCFNEAVQASGGWQVQYHNGRWHVVYLSAIEDDSIAQYGIYVVSYDAATDTWGTPVKIANSGTSYDTHFFPTLVIPQTGTYAGYIHVFYGCHGGACKYARSKNSNDSGSLPGDSSPAWDTGMSIGSTATYPIGLHVQSADRLFMFCRDGVDRRYSFYYSDNNGTSWTGPKPYAENVGASKKRLYQYGFRFDRSRGRLHIAFTYTDFPAGETAMGVWYAYCDYDSGEAEGFHAWKEADGTSCGTTTTDLINRTDLSAIVETGEDNQYFAREIVLLKGGVPLIVLDHHHRDDSAQDPNSLIAAVYDSGWNLYHISDQTGHLNRVGRSGTVGFTDRDGTVHLFTIISGRAYKHATPTADGNYTAWNQTPGTGSRYDKVDDGIHQADSDTTYLSTATNSNKNTFTSSYGIPDNCEVIAVDIEILARIESGTCTIRPMLRISSTDYMAASGQTVSSTTRYKRFNYTWSENPNTSLTWTEAAAEGCEFGVEHYTGSGTCRVTRVTKRILCRTALDEEFWSGEIVEFLSSDDGVNWTARELTENTGLGVPILCSSHDLQNEQMAIVWTSGHQVFFFTDEPFGRMLRSGRDVAVFYAGAEIDRVLDYPNALVTRIYFKCQATIAASRIAGADDYYLYTGNAAGRSRATKGNPDNVFLKFDNFESLVDDSNLNGQRNWTVNSGTITVFDTGGYLAHTNKTYAGGQSIQIDSAGEAEKALGTDVLNVHALIGLWMEGGGGYLGFRLVDGSGNVWEAGLDYSNTKPYYGTGSSSSPSRTTINSPRIRRATYNRFEIQVTASGCSAWVNGVQFADEISAITDADEIQVLSTAVTSYFDFLWVMYRLERRSTDTVAQANIVDKTMAYETSHTLTYTTNDSKHDVGALPLSIYKVEVKIRAKQTDSELLRTATFDVHLSTGASYDSGNWVDNEDGQVVDLVYDTWVYKTVTFDNLDSDQYSVKADFYATTHSTPANIDVELYEVKYYYWIRDPVFDIQTEERQGFYIGATLLGGGRDQFTVGANISGFRIIHRETIRVENLFAFQRQERILVGSLATVAHAFRLALESLELRSRQERILVGWLSSLAFPWQLPVEFAVARVFGYQTPIDFGSTFSQSYQVPLEFLGSLSVTRQVPVEFRGGFTVAARLPSGFLATFSGSDQLRIEFLTETDFKFPAPLEFLGAGASISGIAPVGIRAGVVSRERLLAAFRRQIWTRDQLGIESGGRFSISDRIPVSWLSLFTVSSQLPTEWIGTVIFEASHRIPTEFRQGFARSELTLVETRTGFLGSLQTQIEFLGGYQALAKLPVEYKGTLTLTADSLIEFLSGFEAGRQAPIEFGQFFSRRDLIPLESRAGFQVAELLPAFWRRIQIFGERLRSEWRYQAGTSLLLPVESLGRFVRSDRAPVEKLQGAATSEQLPVEWAGTVAFTAAHRIPVEWNGQVRISEAIPAEFLGGVEITDGKIPIEFSGQFTYSDELLVEHLEKSGAAERFYLEFLELLTAKSAGLVDWLQKRTASWGLPVEFAQAIAAAERLPVEWTGTEVFSLSYGLPLEWRATLATTGKLSVDYLGRQIFDAVLPLEFGGGFGTSAEIPIENRSTIADLVARLTTSWTRQLSEQAKIPIESGSLSGEAVRLVIESLEQRARSGQLPVEWQGTEVFSTGQRLPVTWISTLAERVQLPVESRSMIEVVGDQLLVDWGTRLSESQVLPVEIARGVAIATQLLAEWVGTIEAAGRLTVEFNRRREAVSILVNVEYGERFITETRIPLEWIRTLAFSDQLPVEFMGVAIAWICLANARLKTAGLVNGSLSTPELRDAILSSAGLTGQKLSQAAIDSVALKMARIINGYMKGGGQCPSS